MSEPNDWRGKTCGECGWAHISPAGYNSTDPYLFLCRNGSWQNGIEYGITTPACPAFVPREEPKP